MPVAKNTPGGFLARLTPREHEAFLALGRARRFARGSALMRAGETASGVFVILSGRAKVCYETRGGREVVLAVAGAGDLLGELSAIDREPRSATVVALERVQAHALSSEEFASFLQRHPRVATSLLETLGQRLRDADSGQIGLAAFDTVGRVATRLLDLADRFGRDTERGTVIEPALSHAEIAAWAGSSRESVSKALGALRRRGAIETGRRRIVVRDAEALRRRAT